MQIQYNVAIARFHPHSVSLLWRLLLSVRLSTRRLSLFTISEIDVSDVFIVYSSGHLIYLEMNRPIALPPSTSGDNGGDELENQFILRLPASLPVSSAEFIIINMYIDLNFVIIVFYYNRNVQKV